MCYNLRKGQSCYKVVNLPNLEKMGGGVYEYIRSFKPIVFWRFVSHCIACLFGQ